MKKILVRSFTNIIVDRNNIGRAHVFGFLFGFTDAVKCRLQL